MHLIRLLFKDCRRGKGGWVFVWLQCVYVRIYIVFKAIEYSRVRAYGASLSGRRDTVFNTRTNRLIDERPNEWANE